MMKRIVWLLLSCLMVVALVLSACKPAAEQPGEGKTVKGKVVQEGAAPTTPTKEEMKKEEAAAGPVMVRDAFGNLKEKPRYGGTITEVFTSPTPTQILDPVISSRSHYTAQLTYSRLGMADWSRGPQGTNENPFNLSWHPDAFLTGDLAESWEIPDPLTYIFHFRKGIRWHNIPPMNGREYTADDFLFTWDRVTNDPQSVFYAGPDVPEEERTVVTKIDKYTVELKYYDEGTSAYRFHGLMNWMFQQPREVVEQYGDLSDPKAQIGTGPWIMTDLVPDSSITWKRNPNFHLFDPFFPENRLPYADNFVAIVILDESTRIAALRTHKVERLGVPWDKVDSIKQSNPELGFKKVLPSGARVFFVRTDIEPFSLKKVRHAVGMAIDQPAIAEEFYGGNAYIFMWPVMPASPSVYTPLEELPESSRMLYEYHPDRARELLAEAGYPNGFKTEVILPSSAPRWIDVCAIVKEYLADVGIELELKIQEPTTFGSTLYGKQYDGMAYLQWANNGVDDALGWANGGWVGVGGAPSVYNFGNVVDPDAQAVLESLPRIIDPVERDEVRRVENLRGVDLFWEIEMPTPAAYFFWVPWLKGYAGEVGLGPDPWGNLGVYTYTWIDQDLKFQITGQR